MLDWIFEAIVTWISSVVTQLMDAVSGLFLNALGTDMVAMEEYFPFVTKAFSILQYTAWSILFLITVWQLFRSFGGPITEAENPLTLLARSAIFAVLIGYSKPIFQMTLDIARAPYTALMEISMTSEDFTFAGVEQALTNGLVTFISTASCVGLLLLVILEIALGWNYFKLLLETVERYVVVGVLCYTSPLAFSMGGSKETNSVFKSWCRMVGSQLLLLIMNVWFLRAFDSSVGQFIGNGGIRTAGGVFRGAGNAAGAAGQTASAATGFAAGFANRFRPNSYVRDAVVSGGTRMGVGGSVGFVGRAFGGIAARNGAVLTGESIASVASRPAAVSGSIGGEIADRSLQNFMPQLSGHTLTDTQISGGRISTTAVGADGKETSVEMFNAAQFEKPEAPHALVTASDGSQWYQMASGPASGSFYDVPQFSGSPGEAPQVAASFPDAPDGSVLRTVDHGAIEATSPDGTSTMWYNSAYFNEPDAPHTVMQAANGVDWYAMQQAAEAPAFEPGEAAAAYNQAQFQQFMPGYEQAVTSIDASQRTDGHFEVRHADGSGTMFYDTAQYAAPRGDYQVFEDARGSQWYAIPGQAAVERRPVYENGKPVYDGQNVKTVSVETVRYKTTPIKYAPPAQRAQTEIKAPKLKR